MRETWDAFVKASRNATFLFYRGYMDYHRDRFSDYSQLAYKGNRLMALLPANLTADGVLHSHQGLTYGGWILPENHLDAAEMMPMWEAWFEFCRQQAITSIDYKPLPYIFATQPSQEDVYLLWRYGAQMSQCQLSSVIDLSCRLTFNQQQRRNLRKGMTWEVEIKEEEDVADFMNLLEECLRERHETVPVHSAEELQLLRDRFPDNIKVYTLTADGELCAGVCLYLSGKPEYEERCRMAETGERCGSAGTDKLRQIAETEERYGVAHCQYIAGNEKGRSNGLLTRLFAWLIDRAEESGYRYFDFGTSNEDAGRYLNPGLLRQKYSLGARGLSFPRFSLQL